MIKKEVSRRGRVTFAEYMDLALYHPSEGYYTKGRKIIGAAGDFYTSPDVSPIFGYVLADQMEEMWRLAGSPDEWVLLEMGAGKGNLARDILQRISSKYPYFFRALGYFIAEKSPSMAGHQKELLSGISVPGRGIRWLDGVEDLQGGGVNGCFFSNELLDAFPVHRIIKTGDRLQEIYVDCVNGCLREITGSLSRQELSDYVDEFQIDMEDGQTIEVNLAMREWLKIIARMAGKAFLLTIDYGDTAERLYSPLRGGGTIRSYHRHRLMDSLYEKPGEQDITAHVNFSALIKWGEEAGMKPAGYSSQMYFLLNSGILNYLDRPAGDEKLRFDPSLMKDTYAVKKLVMPEGMGSVFKVALQYKGFDSYPALTAFKGKFGSRP
jgi:SAM-dependent MidA family methyltransferase